MSGLTRRTVTNSLLFYKNALVQSATAIRQREMIAIAPLVS